MELNMKFDELIKRVGDLPNAKYAVKWYVPNEYTDEDNAIAPLPTASSLSIIRLGEARTTRRSIQKAVLASSKTRTPSATSSGPA
jgi:hypothetical protein